MLQEKETPKTPFGQGHQRISAIQFKGRPGFIELRLDPEATLRAILGELEDMLQHNRKLLGTSPIHLQFGARPLDQLQHQEIQRILGQHQLEVTKIEVSPAGIEDFLEDEFGIPVSINLPKMKSAPKHNQAHSPVPAGPTPQAQVPHPNLPTQKPLPQLVQAIAPTHQRPQAPQGAQPPPAAHHTAHTAPQAPPRRAPAGLAPSRPFPQPPNHGPKPRPVYTAPTPQPARPQPQHQASKPTAPKGPIPELNTKPEPVEMTRQRPGIETNALPRAQELVGKKLHKVMKTCRAGTFIDFDGDVVVFGDVNPGAEIRATGDIIVYGALRGIAHAGSRGDHTAIITAFQLAPTQLRLGDQIAIAPQQDEERSRNRQDSEIAYLNQDAQIEVERYQGTVPTFIQQRASIS